MHTGRAEAWRHGKLEYGVWTEVDMKNAYVSIASECDLPAKLKFTLGAISIEQYRKLSACYRLLCNCTVTTDQPIVPWHDGKRTLACRHVYHLDMGYRNQ